MKSLGLTIFALTVAVTGSAWADGHEITECDHLVSHGEDPDRVAPGVSDVLLVAGEAACREAVKNDPDNVRLRYQLARVLFYAQKTEESMPHLNYAADAGSEQAQFVLGYITDEGLQGVKKDPCRVEDLWVRSARQGRFAARVSYPRHVANGKFKGCDIQASSSEIMSFIDAARGQADGYYQQLLVEEVAVTYGTSDHAK
jgi:TPR repeat protein